MQQMLHLTADEITTVSLDRIEEALRGADIGSVVIDIEREPGEPMLFVPGFVPFAAALQNLLPNAGAFFSLGNEFYRSLVIAASGPITAVQKGGSGRIALNEAYLFEAMKEVDMLADQKPAGVSSRAWDRHLDRITGYLLKQDL